MEEIYVEQDERPSFHKMGFDDKFDLELLELKSDYMKRYRVLTAREGLGTNSQIHDVD